VNHALKALQKLAAREYFASPALPRLATGVGGSGIPVFVYSTFHAPIAAQE
jgi:hypothetical protein